jgi:hypothetical protein
MASLRVHFWVSVALAALSFPANGLLILFSWAALAKAISPLFADTHSWLALVLGFFAHVGLFLALASPLWLLARKRSFPFRRNLMVGSAIVYSLTVFVALVTWVGPALSHL